jgi:sarcosine oxidase subunit gamma
MLERRSALASVEPFEMQSVSIAEARSFSLLQVAAPDKQAQALLGKLPKSVGQVAQSGDHTVMRTGPDQFWLIGPEDDDGTGKLRGHAVLTPLSHSRTRIALEGSRARDVLARSTTIDVHPQSFKPGSFAMTGIHHTPVLIHCTGENSFHIYAMRTFALSIWEWLVDAAKGLD